jgi:hypothetical protein
MYTHVQLANKTCHTKTCHKENMLVCNGPVLLQNKTLIVRPLQCAVKTLPPGGPVRAYS